MTARPPRLSAGVVVVRETPEGWRFLLLRAFSHWDFPKGMVEPGEEPLGAAIREVQEESLIDDLEFAWGETSTRTGPYSRGKVVLPSPHRHRGHAADERRARTSSTAISLVDYDERCDCVTRRPVSGPPR
jgi:predicted NUDIX family NTP pyrophosphohydrolase